MKTSYAYTDSLSKVQSDARVISVLGSPIESGFMVSGEVNIQNNSGNADLSYSVSGPYDSATVYVVAERKAGQWTYQTLIVEPDKAGQRIDLLQTP